MKKLNKKWMIAGTVTAVLTASCVVAAAAAYQSNTPQEVSEQQAREIAFKHAGVAEQDVKFINVEEDYDDGVAVYEVEFYAGSREYDYDIVKATGEILKYDNDAEGYTPGGAGGSGSSNNSENSGNSGSSTTVTAEQARAIALEHAGVAEQDVKFINVESDYDDGVAVYEVEFYAGSREYDYDIVKATGEILKYDNDAEGYTPDGTGGSGSSDNAGNSGSSGSSTAVTAEQARAIALEHAGVAESDVKFINVEEDYDDGVAVYEVEFYAGNREYDYDIVKATGEILKYDHDAEGYTPPAVDNGDSQVKITLEEARQKALAKVSGATEQNIRLELDWDDGRPVYEGEIHYGNMEYEFEIDANTGNFLEWSRDYRD